MVYKRFWVQFPSTSKTDWCLGLMIKSYHQEWMLYVEILLKKKIYGERRRVKKWRKGVGRMIERRKANKKN